MASLLLNGIPYPQAFSGASPLIDPQLFPTVVADDKYKTVEEVIVKGRIDVLGVARVDRRDRDKVRASSFVANRRPKLTH